MRNNGYGDPEAVAARSRPSQEGAAWGRELGLAFTVLATELRRALGQPGPEQAIQSATLEALAAAVSAQQTALMELAASIRELAARPIVIETKQPRVKVAVNPELRVAARRRTVKRNPVTDQIESVTDEPVAGGDADRART